jgi:hypothetical protein
MHVADDVAGVVVLPLLMPTPLSSWFTSPPASRRAPVPVVLTFVRRLNALPTPKLALL